MIYTAGPVKNLKIDLYDIKFLFLLYLKTKKKKHRKFVNIFHTDCRDSVCIALW